jgi:hypothetical protein
VDSYLYSKQPSSFRHDYAADAQGWNEAYEGLLKRDRKMVDDYQDEIDVMLIFVS